MKKLFSIMLVLMMVGVVAFAEFDIASLSDSELLTLKSQVDAAIEERGLNTEKEISKGVYVIGQNIPSGGYKFTAHEADSTWIFLGVYEKEEDIFDSENLEIFSYCLTNDGDSIHIDLPKGKVLYVNTPHGSCTYTAD